MSFLDGSTCLTRSASSSNGLLNVLSKTDKILEDELASIQIL